MRSLASIRALEHVSPGSFRRWVLWGVWLGTVGYAIGMVVSAVVEPGVIAPRVPEAITVLAGVIALVLIHRHREREGALLFLAAAFTEIHLSSFTYGILGPSLVVAPVFVMAVGMFLGPRASLATGLVSLILTGLAAAFDGVHPGLGQDEIEQLVFFGLAVMGAAAMTALGVWSFGEVAESAERNRAQAEDLVRNAPDGILLLDERGRVRDLNPAAARILGRGEASLRGATLDSIGLAAAGPTPAPDRSAIELTVRAPDGELRHVEATVRAATGPATVRGLQLMLRDVTDRVRAETRDRLLREQMQRSQRLAAVGSLAGGMAHDFNNLFTVIRGSADLVKLEGGEALQALASDILEAESRGATLIRQLLTFAQRLPGERRRLSPAAEVRRLEPMLRGLITDRCILEVSASAQGRIMADPGELEDVLVHLVDNAREACPDGGHVEIEMVDASVDGADAGSAPAVRIRVRDDGEGMDPSIQEHVFDPFFTTRGVGRGGLGLSAVHGVVEGVGGRIEVLSTPGEGTTVSVLWPAVADG